jgi:hypothetical protein
MRSSAILFVSMLVVAEASRAQETDDAPSSGAPPALAAQPANEPATPTNSSGANHALSAETAGRVVAGLPKYSAPKAKGTSGDASSETQETDKPRNGIIRLPRYHVREQKVPDFKNRELLTPEGKLDLALKRRPGLKVGNFFGMNNGIAMRMLAEDDAYERRLEMQELSSFTAWIDKNYPVDPKTGQRAEVESSSQPSAAGGASTAPTSRTPAHK